MKLETGRFSLHGSGWGQGTGTGGRGATVRLQQSFLPLCGAGLCEVPAC